ncbi:MAG: serine protease [Elusimicrobiota bacterium]|jgi:serine protease Do
MILSTAFLSGLLALAAAAPAAALRGDSSPRQIYQRVGPGVVLLLCVSKDGAGEMGTGSIIDAEGHVLTNAHVVLQASTGKPYPVLHAYLKPAKLTGNPKIDLVDPISAKVVAWDRELDLALLKLEETPSRYKIVPLGDAAAVESGDPVVAIGHPEQGGLWTLTQGVVSTVIANLGGVEGKDVFQTDASINRGNSGGPLLDGRGAMIGVNTSMARKAKDGLTITSVNFALKSDVVKSWLAKNGQNVSAAVPAEAPAEEKPAAPARPQPEPIISAEPPATEPPAAAGKGPQSPSVSNSVRTVPAELPIPQASEGSLAPLPETAQPQILTPVKPFKAEDLIEKEISEMEDLEKEMQGEIDKRRSQFQ